MNIIVAISAGIIAIWVAYVDICQSRLPITVPLLFTAAAIALPGTISAIACRDEHGGAPAPLFATLAVGVVLGVVAIVTAFQRLLSCM